MLTLYQFPNSHYCEKIRWALTYKQLDYQVKNLLPGFHQSIGKRYGLPTSSLPILVDKGVAVQNSSAIITYLDEIYADKPLTPADADFRKEALDWELFADEQIGIPIRVVFYQTLLDRPATLIPMFTGNGPWYGKFLLRLIFPILSSAMRKSMGINPANAEKAKLELSEAMDKLHSHLQHRQYLVGDSFTRADLAVAAMLAPLSRQKEFGIRWPQTYPEDLEAIINQQRDKLVWVDRIYKDYR